MSKEHGYTSLIRWTGNRGEGTRSYRSYDRTWEIRTPGKPPVLCSNDPLLGGNPALHNPEDLLLSALAWMSPSMPVMLLCSCSSERFVFNVPS